MRTRMLAMGDKYMQSYISTAAGASTSPSQPMAASAIPVSAVREIDTISRRAPIPWSAVAVCKREILAKANNDSGVSTAPSLSKIPNTSVGELNDLSSGCPGELVHLGEEVLPGFKVETNRLDPT